MDKIPQEYIRNLYRAFMVLLVIASLYMLARTFGYQPAATRGEERTIVLSGHGEVQAVPDIANVYFTIRKDGKTVKEAQDAVAKVEGMALELLKDKGIEDKDIQASNASFNPKYEYIYDVVLPCTKFGCPPRQGRNSLTGYEAYESITVKVRNIDTTGEIMQGLGVLGVTDLSGPNFAIDNEENLKAEARKKAIDDARTKAEALAEDLGVRLGKVSNFSESGGYYPVMMYAKDGVESAEAGNVAPQSAQLPKGENTISSDVTITYEIR